MIRLDEVRAVYRQALAAVKNHSAELLVKLPFHGKFGFYAGGRVREPTNRFDFRVGVQHICRVGTAHHPLPLERSNEIKRLNKDQPSG